MFKIVHLVKRKNSITHEQFREHFERSHAQLALKYCGHLFIEYRRNYINMIQGGGDPRQEGSGFGPMEWNWDLISEWILPDEETFDEIHRIFQTPEINYLFEEDEARFIDRKATMMMPCTAVFNTGTTFNPKGTVFDTATGIPSWDFDTVTGLPPL